MHFHSASHTCLGVALGESLAWLGLASTTIAASQAVKSASPLKIVEVLFEDYQGWPSPRFEMKAGGEVVLTFRVEGFERLPDISETGLPAEQVGLEYEVELQDPQGILVAPVEKGEVRTTLATQDEKWRPLVRWSAAVPASAPSGSYPVRIRVSDRIGDQQATHDASFRVLGESTRPSATLEVQQVEYASSEDGPWNPQRYFALSDPMHVRYKIVGFRVSPEKLVWVEQDWSVMDQEGQVVLSEEKAAGEKLESFYPPRFLSTAFSLALRDPRPGPYTLRITVRDRIGNQTTFLDSRFVLRP